MLLRAHPGRPYVHTRAIERTVRTPMSGDDSGFILYGRVLDHTVKQGAGVSRSFHG